MQYEVKSDKKIVCMWLTHSDINDAAVQAFVSSLVRQYRDYLVVTYHSGHDSMPETTSALLIYNRNLFAQRKGE